MSSWMLMNADQGRPGVSPRTVLGMYWKRTTSNAAFWATILLVPVWTLINFLFPSIPFLDQKMMSFLIVVLNILVISITGPHETGKEISLPEGLFKTERSLNILSVIIVFLFAAIYTLFW